MTSRSPELNGAEITFGTSALTFPGLFEGGIVWVTCKINLIFLPRTLADDEVRSVEASDERPHL